MRTTHSRKRAVAQVEAETERARHARRGHRPHDTADGFSVRYTSRIIISATSNANRKLRVCICERRAETDFMNPSVHRLTGSHSRFRPPLCVDVSRADSITGTSDTRSGRGPTRTGVLTLGYAMERERTRPAKTPSAGATCLASHLTTTTSTWTFQWKPA